MSRVFLTALLIVCAAPAFAEQPPLAIVLRDHQFIPAELTVPAGTKVELAVSNEQAVPAEFESASLHREKVIPPGGSISVYVGPLQPGRYEFFDDFHPATRGFIVAR